MIKTFNSTILLRCVWDCHLMFNCHIPEFNQVQPWPWTTSDHLVHLGSSASVHPQYPDFSTILDHLDHWTIWLLGLSMTLYGLPHLDSIVSLPCHSLTSTCTRLTLRVPVLMPLRPLGTAPHSFLQILYLAAAWTSTFPKHAAFSPQTLPLYHTI